MPMEPDHMVVPPRSAAAAAGRPGVLRAIGRLLLLGVFLLSTAYAQNLYKSIGPDGRIVYSDRPPAEGRLEKTMKPDNAPAGAVPTAAAKQAKAVIQLKPYVAGTGTILYAAAWCGYCRQAKAYLGNKGIAYQEFDVDTSEGRASFAKAGGGGIPLLLEDGQRVRGFSASSYDAFFAGRK